MAIDSRYKGKFGKEVEALPETTLTAISNLKAETVNFEGKAVNVLGYYTKGDGGGGLFYWDDASTEADNGGTIIQATAIVTGRWKRVLNESIFVNYFGFSEANTAMDNTIAFQNAIDFVSNLGDYVWGKSEIKVQKGDYSCNELFLNGVRGLTISGEFGSQGTIIRFTGVNSLFEVDPFQLTPTSYYYGACSNTTFKNITLRDDRKIDTQDINTRTTIGIQSNGNNNFTLDNVNFLGFKYGCAMTSGGYGSSIKYCEFSRCDVGMYVGPGCQVTTIKETGFNICGESLIIEYSRKTNVLNCNFQDSFKADIVFRHKALTLFNLDTTALGQKYELNCTLQDNWHETGAWGTGWDSKTHILLDADTAYPIRNISIIKPIILSGTFGMAAKSDVGVYSFLEIINSSFISLEDPTISNGRLDCYINSINSGQGYFKDGRSVNGFNPIANFIGDDSTFTHENTIDSVLDKKGFLLRMDFIERSTGHKNRIQSKVNGKIGFSFNTAGTWYERFLIDIQNSQIDFSGVTIGKGSGNPEGVRSASVGSIFMRQDQGNVYYKESGTGNTGWVSLKPEDFKAWVISKGIGGFSPSYSLDLNDVLESGFKYANTESLNRPSGYNGYLFTQAFNINSILQTFYNTNGQDVYRRNKSSGEWGIWKKTSAPPIPNTANPYLTEAAMHLDQANQLEGYGYLVDGVGAFTYLGTLAGTAADYRPFIDISGKLDKGFYSGNAEDLYDDTIRLTTYDTLMVTTQILDDYSNIISLLSNYNNSAYILIKSTGEIKFVTVENTTYLNDLVILNATGCLIRYWGNGTGRDLFLRDFNVYEKEATFQTTYSDGDRVITVYNLTTSTYTPLGDANNDENYYSYTFYRDKSISTVLDLRASNLASDLTTAEQDGIKTKLDIINREYKLIPTDADYEAISGDENKILIFNGGTFKIPQNIFSEGDTFICGTDTGSTSGITVLTNNIINTTLPGYCIFVNADGSTYKLRPSASFKIEITSGLHGYLSGDLIKEYEIFESPNGTLYEVGVDDTGARTSIAL